MPFLKHQTIDITLSDEFSTTALLAQARAELDLSPNVVALDWGVALSRSSAVHYTVTSNAAATAALRDLSANETNLNLTLMNYRIRIENTRTDVIYRATVAHVFTPTNQGATGVVIGVINCFTNGTGQTLYLPTTNGVVVDPPTNNGTIAPMIVQIASHTRATVPSDRTRTVIGVGEVVDLTFVPENNPALQNLSWSVSGGGTVTVPNGDEPWSVVFTAALTKTACSITADFDGGLCSKAFAIIAPTGYVSAVLKNDNAPNPSNYGHVFQPGEPGAMMQNSPIVIGPTNVSFGNVTIFEGSCPGTDTTGYYTNHIPPAHNYLTGANKPIQLNAANNWYSDIAGYGCSFPPVQAGGYTWHIPATWTVNFSGITNSMSGWSQMASNDTNATCTVSKFGHYVTRTIVGLTDFE